MAPSNAAACGAAPTNKNPPSDWAIYPDLDAAHKAASDHAAIYIYVNL